MRFIDTTYTAEGKDPQPITINVDHIKHVRPAINDRTRIHFACAPFHLIVDESYEHFTMRLRAR